LLKEFTPNFRQFCSLAKKGNLIPVCAEFLADTQTPVLATLKLDKGPYTFLLESVEGTEKWAAYSFLGIDPKIIFSCTGDQIEIIMGKRVIRKIIQGNPFRELKRLLDQYRPVPLSHFPGMPRFYGGAVGFFGYDCIRFFEEIPDENKNDFNIPDALFVITDTLVIFNNIHHQIQIIANALLPEKPSHKELKRIYQDAQRKIQKIYEKLSKNLPRLKKKPRIKTTRKSGQKICPKRRCHSGCPFQSIRWHDQPLSFPNLSSPKKG